jgi:hypothetical protein
LIAAIALTALMAWGALCWWLRGGAFGRLCRHGKTMEQVLDLAGAIRSPIAALRDGFEPGTQATRGATMLMLAAPLVFIDWRLVALWPALWIAVAALGWGSYMDMGDAAEPDNERTAALLRLIGLKDGTELYDFAGMTLTGSLRGAFLAAALYAIGYVGWPMLALAAMGPVYWSGWRVQKRLPRDYTEICEMAVGAVVAGLLFWSITLGRTAYDLSSGWPA